MSDPAEEQIDPPESGSLDGLLPDERVAQNEVTARRVNEAIEEGLVNRDGRAGFICECGQLGCSAVVELTLREYEAVRVDGRQFVLVAGHEAAFDRVIQVRPGHSIVAKQGFAGAIADRTDPRAER
jgi:hypothetical protein